jgi:ABC-type Fe3+ transport system permease subunit
MFQRNLELIGLGIVFVMNMVTSYYLSYDIYDISKNTNHPTFLYVIYASMLFVTISSVLMSITLMQLKNIYNSNGEENIQFSPENKKKYNEFKGIFITCIVFIGILCLIFVLQPNTYGFYSFCFEFDKELYYIPCLILYSMKIVLSGLLLGLSSYLVYIANDLAKLPEQIII